jgi:transaldolase
MHFFVDTVNVEEVRRAKLMGVLDGVTTNPSLVARAKLATGKKFHGIISEICHECGGSDQIAPDQWQVPVSVEVLHTDAAGMVTEGIELAKIASNVVVKLPCTVDGLQACAELSKLAVATNMTLCFSPMQALLVAKAGATYVSPFVGRIDDVGDSGMDLIANIKIIYQNYGITTKILVASVRNANHILNAARIGADVVTVPYTVINSLMDHHLTTKGLEIFLDDARRANQDNR